MNTHQNATRWMLVLLGLLLQGQAMAFTQTLYLFSEVKGTVLLDGQPVEGVEVKQEYHWHWKKEKKSSTITTDEQGRFSFPTVTGKSISADLPPHEPVIVQYLRIRHEGKEYQGWFHAKHNYENLGERKGRPIHLKCELTDEPGPHPDIDSYGTCTAAE